MRAAAAAAGAATATGAATGPATGPATGASPSAPAVDKGFLDAERMQMLKDGTRNVLAGAAHVGARTAPLVDAFVKGYHGRGLEGGSEKEKPGEPANPMNALDVSSGKKPGSEAASATPPAQTTPQPDSQVVPAASTKPTEKKEEEFVLHGAS